MNTDNITTNNEINQVTNTNTNANNESTSTQIKESSSSTQIKELLTKIFDDDQAKILIIDKTIAFVQSIIDQDKINQYIDEVKKIITIVRRDDSPFVEAIEVLPSIKNIIQDLYAHLELIKSAVLSKSDRDFVKNHIDIIGQTVIISALIEVEEFGLIDKSNLIKILNIVRVASVLSINMDVKKIFGLCCGRKNNQ